VTHDELVNEVVYGEQTRFALANALRAVVELHSQNQYIDWTTVHQDELNRTQIGVNVISNYCKECKVEYPCPTVQAIEKELG
jgi:hypothetical protein